MTIGRIPSVEGGIQPTIVDAKGDLIAATAADTVNRLAVGSNDQVLVADSSASTGLAWKSYAFQAQNPILNSGFDIWQRGTSFAGTSANTNTFGPDRWAIFRTGYTFSRQTTSDTTNLPNIQYCLRVQRNSGVTSTDHGIATNQFETVNSIPFAGKTVTISFYARAGANYSASSSALKVQVNVGTGTDQRVLDGYTNGANAIDSNVTLTTTWQRFSVTGNIPSTTTELSTTFIMYPTGTAGTNDYFEVTGVQLDVGSTATPYKRAMNTLQGELAACQRYYWRTTTTEASVSFGFGLAASTSQVDFDVSFPTTMRTKPSGIDFSGLIAADGVTSTATNGLVLFKATNQRAYIYNSGLTGLTQYRPYFLNGNTSTSYIGFTAEL